VPTSFGSLVGYLNAANELWLGHVVCWEPVIDRLNPSQFAGLIHAVTKDFSRKASDIKVRPSSALMDAVSELEDHAERLREDQENELIDLSIPVDINTASLVEAWADGMSWEELTARTNLEQGDLCSLIRRTAEVLRQLSSLPHGYIRDRVVSAQVPELAAAAVRRIDRYPVREEQPLDSSSRDRVLLEEVLYEEATGTGGEIPDESEDEEGGEGEDAFEEEAPPPGGTWIDDALVAEAREGIEEDQVFQQQQPPPQRRGRARPQPLPPPPPAVDSGYGYGYEVVPGRSGF